ncbi:hypothetical protein BACCAP_02462 [Pseudoflavonifractor capillosus ATCC 29799]|uniref:Uncharacterized protein n=1 Tax=Pseudoflavonifractor capillosus ATCC 29799 TaxID=411467 RepID=A6NW70_9FIRM|nr:hypothetical protein BACCAP_02462 [Pseudoflavonifractor capillosus ATCC 29799]
MDIKIPQFRACIRNWGIFHGKYSCDVNDCLVFENQSRI